MKLFRSLKEHSDGWPEAGPSAKKLGVRPGNVPTPDVKAVQPDELVVPGGGGMSVAPDDPMYLPRHRRPQSLGGISPDPTWYIETAELGPDLAFRQDSRTHGVIEPSRPMTLQEFQQALAATRLQWKLHCR